MVRTLIGGARAICTPYGTGVAQAFSASAINLSPVVGDNERSMKGLLRRRRGHPTHRTNFVRNPTRHVKHFGTICPLRLAAKPLG